MIEWEPSNIIYPWEKPTTKFWKGNPDFRLLPILTTAELAEEFLRKDPDAINATIIELIAHGNQRRAAQLARELVRKDPLLEDSIRASFGNTASILLYRPEAMLPSCPSEYPKWAQLKFIQ